VSRCHSTVRAELNATVVVRTHSHDRRADNRTSERSQVTPTPRRQPTKQRMVGEWCESSCRHELVVLGVGLVVVWVVADSDEAGNNALSKSARARGPMILR
jgi:hypothetical protein